MMGEGRMSYKMGENDYLIMNELEGSPNLDHEALHNNMLQPTLNIGVLRICAQISYNRPLYHYPKASRHF